MRLSTALLMVGWAFAALADGESFQQGELQQESGDNYGATNAASTAVGGYQMTEAALESAGYLTINSGVTSSDYDGNLSNVTWTGKDGIDSTQEFLESSAAQTDAFDAYSSQVWSADESAGLENDVGGTVAGQEMNQSAILAGSYLLGTSGMQSYIANNGAVYENAAGQPCSAGSSGCTENAELTANAQSYIANGSQYDSSSITSSSMTVAESAAGQNSSFGSGNVSSLYCSTAVNNVLNQGALQYVAQEQAMATSPSTGFTMLNGNSISQAAGLSPGASSTGGSTGNFADFSCLDNLLGGNLNILFEPPNLSSILQSLINQVCQAGQALITQMMQPIDQSLYSSENLGGFFPGMNLPSLGSGISTSFSEGGTPGISVSGIGGSTSWYGTSQTVQQPVYFSNLLQ